MFNERDKQVIRGALRVMQRLTQCGLLELDYTLGDAFAAGEARAVRLPDVDELELLTNARELEAAR